MNGKMYRLREFLRAEDGRGLVVDASAGLSLGTLPGLEDFGKAARAVLGTVDGLVCSPGQLRRLQERRREEAGLLVRMDWNNTLRKADFVLPPTTPTLIPILTPQDALDLGAAAMATTFVLGYQEEIEASSMRATAQMAMEGEAIGLPLVVEVQANGPRVSLPGKAVELGASYALEGGADVIVIPYPGRASLETIASFVSAPWLVKAGRVEEAGAVLAEVIELGGAGVWLDQQVFSLADPAGTLRQISEALHRPVAA